MRRTPLYSTRRAPVTSEAPAAPAAQAVAAVVAATAVSQTIDPPSNSAAPRWRSWAGSPAALWLGMALLAALLAANLWRTGPAGRPLTQKAIDAAVLKTLETHVLPSAAARAQEAA